MLLVVGAIVLCTRMTAVRPRNATAVCEAFGRHMGSIPWDRHHFPGLIQASPPRTGSTLITNVIERMLNQTVYKTHRPWKSVSGPPFTGGSTVGVVATLRHPLDTLISNAVRWLPANQSGEATLRQLLNSPSFNWTTVVDEYRRYGGESLAHCIRNATKVPPRLQVYTSRTDIAVLLNATMRKVAPYFRLDGCTASRGSRLLLLRYESFATDVAWAVDTLELFFGCRLRSERKEEIARELSVSAVSTRLAALNKAQGGAANFSLLDPRTRLHGNHISSLTSEHGVSYHKRTSCCRVWSTRCCKTTC